MKEKVIVVDENNKIIGAKYRSELDGKKDIIRVSGIWIENEKGEILLVQRSFNKKYDAGKWGPSAAGTLEVGDTYESNIIKEVAEELGVFIESKDVRHIKTFFLEAMNNFFVGLFYAKMNSQTKFKLQKEEVEAIRWLFIDEIRKRINSHLEEFTTHFDTEFNYLLEWKKDHE